ncbi:MAG: hypothetical protein WBO25_13290, partial [Acidimicrobiia bacterium]
LRLTSLPPIPQLLTLNIRQPFHPAPPQRQVSSKVMQRSLETTAPMDGAFWAKCSTSVPTSARR